MSDADHVQKDSDFWHLVAKYRRANRDVMLEFMEGTARNSSEIADRLGIARATAAVYLKQAQEEDIIECVTPEADRYKMYRLTERGRALLEELWRNQA